MKVSGDKLSSIQLAMLVDIERAELKRSGVEFVGPIKPKVSLAVEKLVPNLMEET